jgi:hypothetical protein
LNATTYEVGRLTLSPIAIGIAASERMWDAILHMTTLL